MVLITRAFQIMSTQMSWNLSSISAPFGTSVHQGQPHSLLWHGRHAQMTVGDATFYRSHVDIGFHLSVSSKPTGNDSSFKEQEGWVTEGADSDFSLAVWNHPSSSPLYTSVLSMATERQRSIESL